MGKRRVLTIAAFVSASLLAIPTLGLPAANAFAAGSAVVGASLQVSSTSATADQVSYSLTFQAVHPLIAGKSIITVVLPANAAVASGNCAVVTDDATQTLGCNPPTVSGGDVTVTSPEGVAAGDLVSVMLPGVTNPSGSGLRTVLVSTSADAAGVPLHFVLAPATAVTDAVLQLSSGSAQASRVTYSVTFRAPDRFINSQNQRPTITLVAPSGTVFPPYSCGAYEFIDDTRSSTGGCGPTPNAVGAGPR